VLLAGGYELKDYGRVTVDEVVRKVQANQSRLSRENKRSGKPQRNRDATLFAIGEAVRRWSRWASMRKLPGRCFPKQ